MLIIDKKSNKNKVVKIFFRKVKEHTENTEIKVNIDIFYELFRLVDAMDSRVQVLFFNDLIYQSQYNPDPQIII